jgi:predicted dehydrogenase
MKSSRCGRLFDFRLQRLRNDDAFMKTPNRLTRRAFVRRASAAATSFAVVPGHVLGLNGATPPSGRLNIACIGVGGRGRDDVNGIAGENIVALCDVDWRNAVRTFETYPNAKQYKDFRRLYDEMEKQFDAVVVATPDHTHAVAVMPALKLGKHVYCEKPLAHSIHEVQALVDAARNSKVITQLGNQGHSSDSIRTFYEWIRDGAIGTVSEVHAFCGSNYSRIDRLAELNRAHPIPNTLDWDLWLGPAEPRPYNPVYLPGKWRGWSRFGTGVIGDWTCHVIDPVFWALDLGAPTHIQAEAPGYDPRRHAETFPNGAIVRYDFPARNNRPPVKVFWYDGSQQPPRPAELSPNEKLPGIGAVVVGDRGKIVYGSHGAGGLKIIPEARMNEFRSRPPGLRLSRSPGHYREWIDACKGGRPCGSNFDYGGSLTQIALLGVIALKLKGAKLEWDAAAMKFSNSPEGNRYLQEPYRKGWQL